MLPPKGVYLPISKLHSEVTAHLPIIILVKKLLLRSNFITECCSQSDTFEGNIYFADDITSATDNHAYSMECLNCGSYK